MNSYFANVKSASNISVSRMAEVTFKGEKITLAGEFLKAGDRAPEAVVVKTDLSEKRIGGAKEKAQLIITVPSLDTPVCEAETKRFNELLRDYNLDVTVVSMDLPFASSRFCEANGIKIEVASDFRYRDMEKYGVLIASSALKGLLARAIFLINPEGEVVYSQLVPEIAQEPDYQEVLDAIKKL